MYNRAMKAAFIIALSALVIVSIIVGAMLGGHASDAPVKHSLSYVVMGIGEAHLTYNNDTGGTNQDVVYLDKSNGYRWEKELSPKPGTFLYLSAQNGGHVYGMLKISIQRDGVPVREAESPAEFGIATVSGTYQ